MRIQHNIAALNAHRQLTANNNAVSKNLEKLSSGYKINRAGDDAAGLAISEKMRGQIRGLDQATNNANDGISLVQTAEGALNETASILQRMKELATQASNGTYQNAVDRDNISKEVTSLKSEIDRISTSTNFNKINLLDGSLSSDGSTAAKVTASVAVSTQAATKAIFTTAAVAATGADGTKDYTIQTQGTDGTIQNHTISLTYDGTLKTFTDAKGNAVGVSALGTATDTETATALSAALNNTDLADSFNIASATNTLVLTAKTAGASGEKVIGFTDNAAAKTVTKTAGTGADAYQYLSGTSLTAFDGTNADAATFTVNGAKFAFVAAGTSSDATKMSKLGSDVNFVEAAGATVVQADLAAMVNQINGKLGLQAETDAVTTTQINFKTSTNAVPGKGALSLQIGASATADQQVSLSIGNMSSTGLGISNISVLSQDTAKSAINAIDNAINSVSGTRADLGALQNRLEHTVTNLGTTSENLTSAESRIRDVDMAKEMMEMTKNNVLAQAAQSMLAQANTQPQNVLKLLQ